MKLKLDENLSRHLKAPLAELGHDVDTVADEALLSQPDPRIAAAAAAEGRILLTLDLEFADLRKYPPGSHPGMVLFRPARKSVLVINDLVLTFARSAPWDELAGCVVVVDSERIRVRSPG